MNNDFHIGNMIKSCIEQKQIRPTHLSKAMGISNTAIYGFQKQSKLNSRTLLALCHSLKHNFFKDIAARLPADYSSNALSPAATIDPNIEIMAQQAELIKKLQTENDLLRALFAQR